MVFKLLIVTELKPFGTLKNDMFTHKGLVKFRYSRKNPMGLSNSSFVIIESWTIVNETKQCGDRSKEISDSITRNGREVIGLESVANSFNNCFVDIPCNTPLNTDTELIPFGTKTIFLQFVRDYEVGIILRKCAQKQPQ